MLFVLASLVLVCDVSELALVRLLHVEQFDVAKRLEKIPNILFFLVQRHEVEINLANVFLGVTCIVLGWLVQADGASAFHLLKALVRRILFPELNVGKPLVGAVWVHGDLGALYFSKFFKRVKQELVGQFGLVVVLRHLVEDVHAFLLALGLLVVALVRKGPALVVFNVKVPHLLLGQLKLLLVCHVEHRRVEWFEEVTLDDRSLGADVHTLLLEDGSDLDGADEFLGQVVEVQVVGFV